MKTTWREERAATNRRGRTQHEQHGRKGGNGEQQQGRIEAQEPGPEPGPRTRTSQHVGVHQEEKLQQAAPAEPHQVRRNTTLGHHQQDEAIIKYTLGIYFITIHSGKDQQAVKSVRI